MNNETKIRLSSWATELAKTFSDQVFNIETSFYKLITVLTAGAIFLSASFVNQIVPLGEADLKILLIAAWVVYALNLAWICFSVIFSAKFKDDAAGIFVKFQIYEDTNKFFEEGRQLSKRSSFLYANVAVSTLVFLVGTGLLITFIAINQF